MIDRNYPFDDFDVYCDFCDNEINIDTDGDFREAIAEIKERGWKVFKQNGEWKHKCPDCVEAGLTMREPTC